MQHRKREPRPTTGRKNRKHNIETLTKDAAARGYQVAPGQTLDHTWTIIDFICPNGHAWQVQAYVFLRGSGCPKCLKDKWANALQTARNKRNSDTAAREEKRKTLYDQIVAQVTLTGGTVETPFDPQTFRTKSKITIRLADGSRREVLVENIRRQTLLHQS